MNQILPTSQLTANRVRKSAVYDIMTAVVEDLDLTPTQLDAAKTSYEAVADWLKDSPDPVLRDIVIYPHGSTGLGTSVRPLNREDFDVDLICHVPGFAAQRGPAELKYIVGARLRDHKVYAGMLEEKKRCWRLDYKREFHLDISPTIINPLCEYGGELVPDRKLRDWKETNPKGYKAWFAERAAVTPRMILSNATAQDEAVVVPFPAPLNNKGILRRIVQLLKRHRDIHFQYVQEEVAPISIVITTLAARAYELLVHTSTFESELDVAIGVIRLMPRFIETRVENGRTAIWVANPTTRLENFADRWNTEPARVVAFNAWQAKVLADFELFGRLEGLDAVAPALQNSLGETVVRKVMDSRTQAITEARAGNRLHVTVGGGLSLSSASSAMAVPRNTHFGD